ncbi:MAG: DUF1566 domain-containing protein [Vicingaceae bacterium]
MKKIFTIAAAFIMTASVWAQSPEKMSYQAVIRDASNALVTTQAVGMQISILQGGATGTPVYVETQTPTSNANGLVSLEIGTGTLVSGDFTTINWANDTYFIKTETDPTGGTTYTITGTTQLMSVPYALHAKTADNITGTVNYTETDPTFTAWDKSTGISITESQIADLTHTVDTDTHIDSTGIAGLGYVAGGITTETDPVFGASIANGITAIDTANWNNHTVDTDTQLDSTAIAGLGFITSAGSGSTDKFYLGQDTLGGIVYYIYIGSDGNQHGLIVNKNDSTAVWQATGTATGADRSEDGAYNTGLMTSSAAATYVTGLGAGWYLPSIDELGLLYYNRFSVNKALRAGGFTLLLNTATYWSSTEYNTSNAFHFNFYNGYANNDYKGSTYSVRAVRAF